MSWHCFIVTKHKAKFEKSCKKKAEEICVNLATKYESRIKSLDDELNAKKQEIETADEHFAVNTYSPMMPVDSIDESPCEPVVSHARKHSKAKSSSHSASKIKQNTLHNKQDSDVVYQEHFLHKLSNSELNKNLKYYYSKLNSANSGTSSGCAKVFDELSQHHIIPIQVAFSLLLITVNL